jgi:carboxymethylenebutenolidase
MTASPNITAERTTFVVGNRSVDGYLAKPAATTPSAAVIVVQEWWGLNPHIESIVERYADEGFLAAAPDLYHGKSTQDASEAAKLMSGLDQRAALEDLNVVLKHLRATSGIDAVGITGFCMGGTFALLLPCHAKLEASVPYYGDVPADTAILKNLSCPVLFIGGEKDEWIDVPKMKRLEAALAEHKKLGEVRIYKDAPHAFFNDTRVEVYREADAEDAWQRTIDFFNKHLRQGRPAAV